VSLSNACARIVLACLTDPERIGGDEMRIRVVSLIIPMLALVFGSVGLALAKPAGEGAFLVEYADTVQQVVNQVENSRLVALRYAKHFRTDPSTVLTTFRNELSVGKLDETVTLAVYFLDESRNIVSESREFRAGTRVFMNRAGKPLLEYGTGNPLAASLSGANLRTLGETMNSEKPAGQPTSPKDVKVQVLEQPPTELPSQATAANAGVTGASVPAAEAGTVVASNSVALPSPVPVGSASTSSGASIGAASRLLVPLGIAGLAVALGGGGGGNTSGGIVPPPNGGGNEPPPVPEPTSIITLAAGVLTLGGGLFWRRVYNKRRE